LNKFPDAMDYEYDDYYSSEDEYGDYSGINYNCSPKRCPEGKQEEQERARELNLVRETKQTYVFESLPEKTMGDLRNVHVQKDCPEKEAAPVEWKGTIFQSTFNKILPEAKMSYHMNGKKRQYFLEKGGDFKSSEEFCLERTMRDVKYSARDTKWKHYYGGNLQCICGQKLYQYCRVIWNDKWPDTKILIGIDCWKRIEFVNAFAAPPGPVESESASSSEDEF